jgi:hypothetical protein
MAMSLPEGCSEVHRTNGNAGEDTAMRDMYGNEKHTPAVNTVPRHDVTTATETTMEAGKVLALAGGAAGLLAGVLVLLSEREKKQEPKTTLEQAKALIDEAAARAREEGTRAEASLLTGIQGLTADSKKKGKKARKTAKRRGTRFGKKAQSETNETLDKVAQFLKEAREDAAAFATHEAEEVSGLARQFRSDAEKRAEKVRKESKVASKQARKEAERAKGELSSFAELLKGRVVDAEHQAEDYVAGMIVPKLKEMLDQSHDALETGKSRTEELRKKAEKEIIPEAKHRAEDLRKRAESEVLPEAKKRAEELRKRAEKEIIPEAKHRAEELSHTVEEQAKVARKVLEQEAAEAATKLSAAASTVEGQASEATEAVKRGTRETRSLLLWLALAGVLVFTVFLDEEQQKRLKEVAYEIFGEAKDMYADMKGEETFQS